MQSLFVHKHQIKCNRRHAGFTLVEMLAVAPIVLIVIGVLISAMVSMIGDALVANARTVVAYNTRDALNRIEEDARISINFMSTFSLISAPQGKDGGTGAFNSGNDDLIMTQQATTDNPYNNTRDLVYYANQPHSCSGRKTGNRVLLSRVIYFTKAGSDGKKQLWRRVIVRDANKNNPPTVDTVCDLPWQRNTCPVGTNSATYPRCRANDELLLEHITNFRTAYYTKDGAETTNPVLATSIGITISTSEKTAGKDINQSGSVRVSRINDIPPTPPPATPTISIFNQGVAIDNNPTKVTFQWSSANAQAYTVSTRVNGGAWSTPTVTTKTTLGVTTGPSQTVSIRVTAHNDTANSATAQFDTQSDFFANLNLENGWISYNSTPHNNAYAPASFSITSAGFVKLRGLIGGASGKIATLPEGFRPSKRVMVTVMGTSNNAAWVTVDPDGAVAMTNNTTQTWVSLDNVSFLADGRGTWNPVPSGNFTCPSGCSLPWRDYTTSGGGGGFMNTGFAKDAMGRIHLEGLILPPSPNSIPPYSSMFTIPSSSFYSANGRGADDIYPTSSNYSFSDYSIYGTYLMYRYGTGSFYSMHSIYYGTSPTPSWTNASLENSWSNYSAPGTNYSPASFTRASDGVVLIRGLIRFGANSNGTTLFRLPSGYRPKHRLLFLTASNTVAPARIDVFPTGEVQVWNTPNNGWLSLAGINFVAEQ